MMLPFDQRSDQRFDATEFCGFRAEPKESCILLCFRAQPAFQHRIEQYSYVMSFDHETEARWRAFMAIVQGEMRRGLRGFKKRYSSPAGPHSYAARPGATDLEDQIAYRKQQNSLWKSAVRLRDADARIRLVKAQIEDWGGIRKNRKALIEQYALQSAPKLIQRGRFGISSWSKALAIRDPRQYAVYDARVAMSLNAMQASLMGSIQFLFPVPDTQNRTIKKAQRLLRNYIGPETRQLRGRELYSLYVDALKGTKGGHSLHAAELYLFHVGPDWATRLEQPAIESP